MKKAVVTFTVDEGDGSCRVNVSKGDDLKGMDLLAAIGSLYANDIIESGELIGCLSGLIGYITERTDKEWRELLDEIKERMEEVDG